MNLDLWIEFIENLLITVLIGLPWVFFLIHAVQYENDPKKRGVWVIIFLFLNIIAIPIYIYTNYINLFKKGKWDIVTK
jgi:TM2 domain-containing membrane protein YozV